VTSLPEDFFYDLWLTQKMLCAAYARTSEMIGDTDGEVYRFCRAKADEPDRREQIERLQEKDRENKLAALRTPPTPRRREPDPPRGTNHPILGWQPEPEPLLSPDSQAAVHARLAAIPAPDGYGDAHPEQTALKREYAYQMSLPAKDRDWTKHDDLTKEMTPL
jgi:hypothetical protein